MFSDDLLVTSGNASKDKGNPLIDKKMGKWMEQTWWELNKIKWSTEEEWGSSKDGNALFDGKSHPLQQFGYNEHPH